MFESTTAFIKATQIKRNESDSQSHINKNDDDLDVWEDLYYLFLIFFILQFTSRSDWTK